MFSVKGEQRLTRRRSCVLDALAAASGQSLNLISTLDPCKGAGGRREAAVGTAGMRCLEEVVTEEVVTEEVVTEEVVMEEEG